MKIIYLSYQDDNGGAFIGAKRLNHALIKQGVGSCWSDKKYQMIRMSFSTLKISKRFRRGLIAILFLKRENGEKI